MMWLLFSLTLLAPTMTLAAPPPSGSNEDPYLWLEDVDGARSMEWVHARNAEAVKALGQGPEFEKLRTDILGVLDSEERIPGVVRRGAWLYNFWTDHQNPRGLWRRTTLESYRTAKPEWELLIDVDALGKAENKSWVWHGVRCLEPEYRHCMVLLSRGGADAVVVREYDLIKKAFVPGGFTLPEAKTDVSWKDANTIFVGTDFGPGSMTKSGYPRIVKLWKRGTPLSAASRVYEAKPDDMTAVGIHDATPGFERDLLARVIDFYSSETFVRAADGKLTRIEVPIDAEVNLRKQWMTVKLRTPWKVGGKTWPSGALLVAPFDDFMAGKRELTPLFLPDAHTSLSGYTWTQNHLLLTEMKDVVSQLEVLTPHAGAWKRAPLGGAPPLSSVAIVDTDPDHSDEYFMQVDGFVTPSSLYRGVLGKGEPELLKRNPAFFDGKTEEVSQHFATSKDGTKIPYFMVAPRGLKLDGTAPTLLYGYGGFEISLTPGYSGTIGRAWLARGGVYVQANIRGGGEYGPAWHQAALKQNRLRAYEDFAAVAQDLVARKVTSKRHLAIQGGSNGGLLVGNMLTQYPELFEAVVCQVPLLDMRRYTHIAAGASWIAEYGDPDKADEWSYIRTFSPYQNVLAGTKYPGVFFTTTTRDDRVGPVHARKMAAKMLADGCDVRFYENTEGGHGAGADHAQAAFEKALEYHFLWKRVGR